MQTSPGEVAIALDDLLRQGRARLEAAGVEDAALDSRLLVEHFSGTDRLKFLVDPRQPVPPASAAAVHRALERRAAGEPVHRIIGLRSFYGLDLELSPETLEPRSDTETLVDLVLAHAGRSHGASPCRILDLGTGTGAIALALLSHLPEATALGVDLAPGAVRTARLNAARNGLADRFEARHSDWFAEISGRWDFIVSNPPYISRNDMSGLAREVSEFDPPRALDGGADGLDAYRAIARGAASFLAPGGLVALETGHDQREAVTRLFQVHGFCLVEARKDLGGRDRALIFGSPQDSASPEVTGNTSWQDRD
jgi:release factor glutamine methyltransferase